MDVIPIGLYGVVAFRPQTDCGGERHEDRFQIALCVDNDINHPKKNWEWQKYKQFRCDRSDSDRIDCYNDEGEQHFFSCWSGVDCKDDLCDTFMIE